MSASTNASIAREGLLLNLDFGSPKKFTASLGLNNLVTHPNYNAASWTRYFPENSEFITTGIIAPDGTATAVRLRCTTAGLSLLRVGLNTFTPNGTDEYTVLFFVRKISGTTANGGQLWADMLDSIPSYNYLPDLVDGKWTKILFAAIPTGATKTFVDLLSDNTTDYTLDFWGVRVERTVLNEVLPLKDLISGTSFLVSNNKFFDLEEDFIRFDRTTIGGKWGSCCYGLLSGELTSTNFLYNNHSLELWFRIDDISATSADGTEGNSILAVYAGYHSGLFYFPNQIVYQLWNGVSTMPTCAFWNKDEHFTVGVWAQLVVTRAGNDFTAYMNGRNISTGSTQIANAAGIGTGNTLCLGAVGRVNQGVGNYMCYSKNSISKLRMYNRALTASEVAGNFAAHRAKFGI